MNSKYEDLQSLLKFLVVYQSHKSQAVFFHVEKFKNGSVDLLMHRRGRMQKYVWHTSMVGLASIGFLSSGAMGGNSMVASTFPGVNAQNSQSVKTFDPATSQSTIASLINFKTDVSDKPRSETVNYQVKSGETLSQIAEKFSIDTNTIKWANGLDSDVVKPGQDLKILPVSGVAYTVKSGDTLQSVAKKYSADAQGILDFPFNDVPDDLQLKSGQVLIIPDGQPPDAAATPKPKPAPEYVASGPTFSSPAFSAPNGGNFVWPTTFVQYGNMFAWWHPGLDMANNAEPPVQASDGGVVTFAGWDNSGYGNRVDVDHGNGYTTRYAHLSNIYVSVGQRVAQGQALGKMGSTGRSTGPHLHFEIHFKGIAVNPLAILK